MQVLKCVLPCLAGGLSVAFSLSSMFGCETTQYIPYPNATNHTYLDYLYDAKTDLYFLFVLPPPPVVSYGPFRQRAFRFSLGTSESTVNTSEIDINITELSKNVTTVYFQALDECTLVPVSLTALDAMWKYSRTMAALVMLLGTGCVLVFIFIQSVYPYLEKKEYNSIAIVVIVYCVLQATTILFYTRSNACRGYPPLQEQFVNYFDTKLTGQSFDPKKITNLWNDWIIASYPPQCEWAIGCTYTVVASVLWFVTAILMIWIGPTSIVEYPKDEDDGGDNNVSNDE